ncbi:hypothetical protein HQ489_03540 [Candidatus Woesearchaeota archaeon]|nr:hypothetical protein [Candidatus Woesearchaeota archaeon]
MVNKKGGVRKRVSKKKEVIESPKMKMRHKQSWAIIGILFLLSLMTIISLQEKEMSLTGNAVQTVGFMKAGEILTFQIQGVSGLNDATATFSQEARNIVIKFEENNNIPFEQDFYSKFTISSSNEVKIKSLQLTLVLEQRKLDQIPMSRNDIQLFQNGQPVNTVMTKIDGNRLFYTATVTSFGDFVIGKEEGIEKPVMKKVEIEQSNDVASSSPSATEPEEQLPSVIEETVIIGKAIEEPIVAKEKSGFLAWLKGLFN